MRFLFFLFFLLNFSYAKLNFGFNKISDIVKTEHIEAKLIVFSEKPIKEINKQEKFYLGFKLIHKDGWHTYWKNPGDLGIATTLNWTLPDNFELEKEQWQLPKKQEIDGLLNYIYTDEVLIKIPIKINNLNYLESNNLIIKLKANWLACKIECIPEEGDFEIKLNINNNYYLYKEYFDKFKYEEHNFKSKFNIKDRYLNLQIKDSFPFQNIENIEIYPEENGIFNHFKIDKNIKKILIEDNILNTRLPLADDLDIINYQNLNFVLKYEGNIYKIKADNLDFLSPNLIDNNLTNKNNNSFIFILFASLLGGILLNFMPCVFPMLAIKVLKFTNDDNRIFNSLIYSLGVISTFLLFGFLIFILRLSGENLGWGFQLQNPLIIIFLIILFTLIAFNLAGFFEIKQIIPSKLINSHFNNSIIESFISGIISVIIASPCTAPFMGFSLGASLSMNKYQTLLVFFMLGFGMALPYFLLAYFPKWIKYLPKSGEWLIVFRKIMSFPIFLTVIWLIWVLNNQVDIIINILIFLLCLISLIWSLSLKGKLRKILVLLLIIIQGFIIYKISFKINSLNVSYLNNKKENKIDKKIEIWQNWSLNKQEELLNSDYKIFVDFTASWCITCQYNKQILNNEKVLDFFKENNIILLRADWTNPNSEITNELIRLNRNGIPVYAFWVNKKFYLLNEILTVNEILNLSKIISNN